MKSVKIAELKDRLSEHLRAVERGAEVIVTDRNRPIARIIPVRAKPGLLIIEAPNVSFASVRAKKWRRTGWALGSDELLAEERRER
jgi:prevent-host-death family protein